MRGSMAKRTAITTAVYTLIVSFFLVGSILVIHSVVLGHTPSSPTDILILSVVIAIAFFLAVFIPVSVFMSRRVIDPVYKFIEMINAMNKGDFSKRVDVSAGDELEQLARALNQAMIALDEASSEHNNVEFIKTEFLSMIGHELRSPMTPMRAQLQMMLKGYFGKLTQKQLNSLNIVLRNAEHLDHILEDMLEVSRMESARFKFDYELVDLEKFLQSVVDEMKGFLPEKEQKVVFNTGVKIFETDPDRLRQVLRNLINNAKKFSPEKSEISVNVKKLKGEILFCVVDKGKGISKENQMNIFKPFFQEERTFSRKHGGTGLGLTICRGIIETQQGCIWVESEEGKGTKFFFTLPEQPKPLIPFNMFEQLSQR